MMLKKNESGFTLVEVLVAMAIFAIGILAVINMQLVASHTNLKARHITEGILVAQSKVEELRSATYDHISLTTNNADDTLDAANSPTSGLTITQELNQTDRQDYSHPTYKLGWNIANNTPIDGMKTVRVIVKWMHKTRKFSYAVDMIKSDGE